MLPIASTRQRGSPDRRPTFTHLATEQWFFSLVCDGNIDIPDRNLAILSRISGFIREL